MGWLDEFKREYRRRKGLIAPDPLDVDWDLKPRWNYYERRDIRSVLRRRNPVRFARLERDMVWLRSECIKAGLDPEQARFLV